MIAIAFFLTLTLIILFAISDIVTTEQERLSKLMIYFSIIFLFILIFQIFVGSHTEYFIPAQH